MTPRKRRIYVGLMIAGAIALAVDGFVLSGDGSVASASIPRDHQSASGVTAAATAIESPARLPIPEVPFPRAVEDYASALPLRDLFAPVPKAPVIGDDGLTPDKGDPEAQAPSRPSALSSAAFSTRRRLDAVVLIQRLRIAVVDGTWVRVGQVIDRCELRSVSGNEARFLCRDGDAVLTVEIPGVQVRAKVVGGGHR